MRLMTIVHDHPDWTVGGAEIAAAALARAMGARPGVASRLVAVATRLHRPCAAPGALAAQGDDHVLATGAYDRFSMLRLDGAAWVGSLGRLLDAQRPHVVHLHGLDRIGAEVVPALRRLRPQARIVLTLHDYQLICANDGLLLTTQEGARCAAAAPDRCRRCFPQITAARHALRRAHLVALLASVDRIIAPSAFLRDRIVAWGLDPARIAIVPNAVDLGAPAAAPGPGRRTPDRFAFFGNLAARKGVLVLIAAAARLKRAGVEVDIALHGGFGWTGAAFRDEVAARIAEAAPVARLAGEYARDEVLARMRGADWIVAPSIWWENAPLTILEARVAGRPVIASGIGGMAELVRDGVDGLHAPPGDPAALAEVIARAARSPKLWRRLAAGGRPADFEAHVEAHHRLFRGLTEKAPA